MGQWDPVAVQRKLFVMSRPKSSDGRFSVDGGGQALLGSVPGRPPRDGIRRLCIRKTDNTVCFFSNAKYRMRCPVPAPEGVENLRTSEPEPRGHERFIRKQATQAEPVGRDP